MMADPATVGLSMGLNAAGSVMKAIGGQNESEASARLHEYKAGVARQNAIFNRRNSDYTLDAGEQASRRAGLTTGFTIGRQKTAQAASGFDVNEGSSADVRDAQRAAGMEDQTTIRTNAGRKALDFRNKAVSDDMEAQNELTAAENARKAGKINLFSTLLGGASSVASRWSSASRTFSGAGSGITTYDENLQPVAYPAP